MNAHPETARISADQQLAVGADDLVSLLMSILSDGLDHPEVWDEIPNFLEVFHDLPDQMANRLALESDMTAQALLILLRSVALACRGDFEPAFAAVEQLAVKNSQSALVQGALFRLKKLRAPDNPAYELKGRFCSVPFRQLDVLENSSHLCCASWLKESAGNLKQGDWLSVWNSPTARRIRESIHDGSFRYCNKSACPHIASGALPTTGKARGESIKWERIVDEKMTALDEGPESVNLAYDRTCNLACPSCRVEKYAADSATRDSYARMQEDSVLPLLKHARTVFITGSGDPFASKNFRALMKRLTPEEYPDLRFRLMTNAMLFTPRQWDEFPTLHGRTSLMKISVDAATGPTHEKLRLGAKWPVMLENMKFAGELAAEGLIDLVELVFVVQQENYREMGDAVDLAKQVGAGQVYFLRITNWGTFSPAQFAAKAVHMPSHPEHGAFIETMQDERLADPLVILGDLEEFRKPSGRLAAAG